MHAESLSKLHGKRIAVSLKVAGRQVLLKGMGEVYDDPTIGVCLRIVPGDTKEDFELIFKESEWQGEVLPGENVGCDYQICVGESSPSVK